jgi:hypothetical protein
MRSLVTLGRADPQPLPAPTPAAPPVEDPVPQKPPPRPDPTDEQEALALHAALADAGVAATADDQAAVQALARLDADTVAAVARWLRTKPGKGDARG